MLMFKRYNDYHVHDLGLFLIMLTFGNKKQSTADGNVISLAGFAKRLIIFFDLVQEVKFKKRELWYFSTWTVFCYVVLCK